MSTVHVHVEDAGNLIGGQARAAQLIAAQTICVREKCALWNRYTENCGLVFPAKRLDTMGEHLDDLAASATRLANNAAHLANLEPPKDGKSPLMRLAEAVENLVKVNLDKKAAKS